MKKVLLFLSFASLLSAATAQQDPRCPRIHRNNGNAGGCDAKIVLIYDSCPSTNYQLMGLQLNVNNQPIPGLTFTTGACNNGMVQVCVQGSNIPPAATLAYAFGDGTNVLFTCNEIGGGNLPVNISSFNAIRRTKNQVLLSWKTDFELNAKEFVIERKSGTGFVAIGTISAANMLSGSNYSFQDVNASRNSSQYRLRAIDIDGSYSNSDIRNVKGTAGAVDFFVYPNPAMGKTNLNIADSEGEYDVTILDNTGKKIRNFTMSGNYSTELNNLPKGSVLIRVTNKATGESVSKQVSVF